MKQQPISVMRQVLAIASLVVAYNTGASAWVTNVPARSLSSSSTTTATPSTRTRQNFYSPGLFLKHEHGDDTETSVANTNMHQETHNKKDWMEASRQFGRTLVATASLAGVLMLSPANIVSPSSTADHQQWHHPPSSWAAESSLLVASEQQQEGETVFDEVYTLIDKYFIDRTYGGQVRTTNQSSRMFDFTVLD